MKSVIFNYKWPLKVNLNVIFSESKYLSWHRLWVSVSIVEWTLAKGSYGVSRGLVKGAVLVVW